MTLNSKTLAILLVYIMAGGIIGSMLMGWWQTTSSKMPASFTEGEYAGQANPADIRGSYTFADISNSFAVTPEVLAQAFGAGAENPAAFQVKELETLYADSVFEIGTASVRLFVAFYAGLPYDLTSAEETYLPQSAADILKRDAKLTAEQLVFLDAHTVTSGAAAPAQEPAATPAPQAGETAPAAASGETLLIKGKTTFGELTAWGVQQGVIEQVIGAAMPGPAVKIKDFATANNLDFETLKTALQLEVDKIKK